MNTQAYLLVAKAGVGAGARAGAGAGTTSIALATLAALAAVAFSARFTVLRGRERDCVVKQTAIADSAYKCPVNALAGAPDFLIPRADLSHLEEVRCVVEQTIGRVGNSWRAASDKAGAWHMVGNGGIQGTGSMQGMAMSQVYFIVAARLTTMMQSRRKTWTRDPESFEYTDPNSIKLAVALGQL